MKSKYVFGVLFGLVVLLSTASCKSKPPAQEEKPPVEAPASIAVTSSDQATIDDLNKAAARAAAARQVVMDFGGPGFLPKEWQFADSLFTEAEQQKNTSSSAGIHDSIARYDRARAAFESMTPMTYAAAYDYAQSELTTVRNAAVDSGVEVNLPDYLLDADNTVVRAEEKYEAKDYYAAKDAAFEAYDKYELLKWGLDVYWISEDVVKAGAEELIPDYLDEADKVGLEAVDKYLAADYDGARDSVAKAEKMYIALKAGLDAYAVREKITAYDFEVYDPQNIELADNILWTAAEDYSNNNFPAAREKADDAQRRYTLSLATAWGNYAAEKGADASTERQRALDLKANVAVRQEFNSAQAVYVRANSAFQAKNHEQASALYKESETMFVELNRMTLQKRDAAERALNMANQRMVESDETARNAEVVLEGGE